MKIVHIETLILRGAFSQSTDWHNIHAELCQSIEQIEWPENSGSFTIHPGKHLNGVKPIKEGIMIKLEQQGWGLEVPMDIATNKKPGKLDAVLSHRQGNIAVEWETGNISSSHRALNKMSIGLMNGVVIAGILIVPSRRLYPHLTDRIGNYDELEPYIELWKSIPCSEGIFEIIVIEQDAESTEVPVISKGTDGRALL